MRIVLKVSGESLKEGQNISGSCLNRLYEEIISIKSDNELIIVVGGGNFWRGRNELDIDSNISDYIGMIGTCMNALAISDYLNKKGLNSKTYSAFEISGIIDKKSKSLIEKNIKNNIIVLGGGQGVPGFSTDMTTISVAVEYNADLILMSKSIDGIYDKDPKLEDAKKIDKMTHEEFLDLVINQGVDNLLVMDFEAIKLLAKCKIPLYLYSNKETNIKDVMKGTSGTKVIS